jgi:hypothetical protein
MLRPVLEPRTKISVFARATEGCQQSPLGGRCAAPAQRRLRRLMEPPAGRRRCAADRADDALERVAEALEGLL